MTGEPVLASKLSSVGGGLSVLVRPSMRAIRVEVDLPLAAHDLAVEYLVTEDAGLRTCRPAG